MWEKQEQLKTRIGMSIGIIFGGTQHITDHRLEEDHEFDWENIAFWMRNPIQKEIGVRDATHQKTDMWSQPADRFGGAFQGLLSNCRRTINIGALLLPTNQCTLRLNY